MDVTFPDIEKRKSLWSRLLPHKSKNKDKKKKQSADHSGNMKLESFKSSPNEIDDFVTIEPNTFMDVQKNAGILFLNKTAVSKCFSQIDENKHVQFAPTPMNRWYQIDVKSAPSKNINTDKENILQTKYVKPTRPILRLPKNQKSSCSVADKFPRTSTKLALVDQKNCTLSQLNVSSIYDCLSYINENPTQLSLDNLMESETSIQKLRQQSCSAIPKHLEFLKGQDQDCVSYLGLTQRPALELFPCRKLKKPRNSKPPLQSWSLDQNLSDVYANMPSDKINTSKEIERIKLKTFSESREKGGYKIQKSESSFGTEYICKSKQKPKMCKYYSEQCADSSMADDECSFNCSCQSCIKKLSHNLNKEKYFFDIEPDTKDDRLPENRTVQGTMAKAQPHLFCKSNVEACSSEIANKSLELLKSPHGRFICSQIINSATKKDFFSSPIRSLRKAYKQTPIKDSIVLLQEIFQKLSQECQDLLQPDLTASTSGYQTNDSPTITSAYLDGLVKSLKPTEQIGSVDQEPPLKSFASLPNLKKSFVDKAISAANSLDDLKIPCGSSEDSGSNNLEETELLKNLIRLGMGLSPTKKVQSPTKSLKFKSRDVLSGKGKLKLKIYCNSELVTVFVLRAAKLTWTLGRELNCYVKVTMVPDPSKRVHWRTSVQKAQMNPIFNQKFSFKLLHGDESNRLMFSVWHRDFTKLRSELIGCMSFSVEHIMKNNDRIDGWYRLLREKFGIEKHFAA